VKPQLLGEDGVLAKVTAARGLRPVAGPRAPGGLARAVDARGNPWAVAVVRELDTDGLKILFRTAKGRRLLVACLDRAPSAVLAAARRLWVDLLDAEALNRIAAIVRLQGDWLKHRASSLYIDPILVELKIRMLEPERLDVRGQVLTPFDEADARRFSVAIERTVPGEELERLMELSGIDRNKYIKGQVKKVIEAHGKLSNGEMVEAFSQIAFETFYADQLSKPGGLDAFRRVTRLERDLARFHQAGSAEDIEARKRRREIVEQIVNGWAIAVLEGKVPDRNELEKKLAEKNLLGAMLAKLSGIVADKLTAAREGKPYDDEKFVNDLGRALGTDRASEGEQ